MKLRYAPRARADIVHIHDYIAKHNARAATAVVRQIRTTAVCWRGTLALAAKPTLLVFACCRPPATRTSSTIA